jgi:hypothetical protein
VRVTRYNADLVGRPGPHSRVMKRRPGVVVVVGFLLATLAFCVPVGLLGASNLVSGEDHQAGRFAVPASKFVHLPAGTLDASLAIDVVGAGDAAAALPLNDSFKLVITSVPSAPRVVVKRDVGPIHDADDPHLNTQRRVWTVQVPSAGNYYVTTYGNFTAVGSDPEVWLGHGPPLSGAMVLPVSAVLALLTGGLWFLVRRRRRRDLTPG